VLEADIHIVDPLRQRTALQQCVQLFRDRLQRSPGGLLRTLKLYRERMLVYATVEERVVGFKLGFAERDGAFYSWLGAVAADWEGRGLGRRLLTAQHEYLQAARYRLVRTRTRGDLRRMLVLNLRSGFEIVGWHRDTVMFEKNLELLTRELVESPTAEQNGLGGVVIEPLAGPE
jgi:GNAT superfamily N-acetyltransferase